jgi:lipoprotein Spr
LFLKKTVGILFALVLSFSFMVGSAFAETPLNSTVNELMGIPYRDAGITKKGFDCSGFTAFVFSQFDITLPHSSASQGKQGNWVSKDDLRAGDLVFFSTGGGGISHVGIYVGDGMFIHSASGVGISKNKLSEAYYAKHYVSGRRILSDETYDQLAAE